MRRLKTANLRPTDSLPLALHHESGMMLHSAGDRLTIDNIAVMRSCGIDYVYEVGNALEMARLKERTQYRAVRTSSLIEGSMLATAIFSVSRVLLLQANVPITAAIKESLIKRGIGEVYIRKNKTELRESEAMDYLDAVAGKRKKGVADDLPDIYVKDGQDDASAPEPRSKTPTAEKPDLPPHVTGGKEAKEKPDAAERRRHRRVNTDLPIAVYLQRPHSSIWSDENVPATATNMSKGGICLLVSRDLSHEKRLRIKLSYPRLRLTLDAVAEIVRVTPVGEKFEIGAKYLFVGAERDVTR